MNKKQILKKYTGKGGTNSGIISPGRVAKPIGLKPVSTPSQDKPSIPYSKNIASPGPSNLTNVVVPSSRIPNQPNLRKALPAVPRPFTPRISPKSEALPPLSSLKQMPVEEKKVILKNRIQKTKRF